MKFDIDSLLENVKDKNLHENNNEESNSIPLIREKRPNGQGLTRAEYRARYKERKKQACK